MKTFKSILTYCALSLITVSLTSCSKDDIPNAEEAELRTISVSINQPTDESSTKTSLGTLKDGKYPVLWTTNDEIKVTPIGAAGYYTYSLTSGAGTSSGTFTLKEGTAPTGNVAAYYPSSRFTPIDEKEFSVEMPATQTYAKGTFDNGAMSMWGKAESVSKLNSMSCKQSVLIINLTGNCKVKDIVLESTESEHYYPLRFKATINKADGTISLTYGKDYQKITLDCSKETDGGVQLNTTTSTPFYIVLAPSGYQFKLKVTINSTNNQSMTKYFTPSTVFQSGYVKNLTNVLNVTIQ